MQHQFYLCACMWPTFDLSQAEYWNCRFVLYESEPVDIRCYIHTVCYFPHAMFARLALKKVSLSTAILWKRESTIRNDSTIYLRKDNPNS